MQDYSPSSKCDGAADHHHGGGFFSFLNLWTNTKFLPSQVPNLGPHKKGTRQQPPKTKSKYFFSDPKLSPLLHQKSKKNKKLDFSRCPRVQVSLIIIIYAILIIFVSLSNCNYQLNMFCSIFDF